MKVHQSNYQISGFTSAVDDAELGALCRARGILMLDDLGSGNLIDLARYGLPPEPVVTAAIPHADLVTFSGDKLLGGMQCGIIAGRADLIARLRAHPLKRALRVGKETLAAMEVVLRLYLDPDRLAQRLPALRLLTRSHEEITLQAHRLAPAVAACLPEAQIDVLACASQIGSGALPVETLPSAAIAIARAARDKHHGAWLDALSTRFRQLPFPVIGRIREDRFMLDMRTLEQEQEFLRQLQHL